MSSCRATNAKAIKAGERAAKRLRTHHDGMLRSLVTTGDAIALLSRVAAILARRHRVTIAERNLYVGDSRVAGVTGDCKIVVRFAITGKNADIPKGLGRATYTPGSRYATPERIAAAIQARLDAEAADPVPVACPTLSRDPEDCHAQ